MALAPVWSEGLPSGRRTLALGLGASRLGFVWAGGLPSGLEASRLGRRPPVWAEGLPLGLKAFRLRWACCVGWEPSVWTGPPVWVKWFQPGRAEGPPIGDGESPAWACVWAGGPPAWAGCFLPGCGASFWAEGPSIWDGFLLSGLVFFVWAETCLLSGLGPPVCAGVACL